MLLYQQAKAHRAFRLHKQLPPLLEWSILLIPRTTAADASRPVALATPVIPAFPRMPTTSIRSAIAPSAYLVEPEHPFSPLRRQNLRYDVSHSEVPSQDDFYGNPRDSYSYHNSRFARGKGKGKLSKGRAMRNANPKDWDETQTVIPEFGGKTGIVFYTIPSLLTETCQYRVGAVQAFVTSSVPGQGQLLQHMEIQQIRMRAHPTDISPDGQVSSDRRGSDKLPQGSIGYLL